MMDSDDEKTQMRYAQALADWGDVGGYEAETLWDVCTVAALGTPYDRAQWREVRTLSGGEQKRLVLEALLRGPDEVLHARRAGQLPRRAGQALARGRAGRVAQDRAVRQPRPRAAGPDGDPHRHARAGAGRIDGLGARRRLRHVPPGPRGPHPAARGAAPALGRGARQAQGAGADVPAEGGVQRRDGQPAAGGRDPAGQVRGGRAAGGAAARAERQDAAARRPHRQAGASSASASS